MTATGDQGADAWAVHRPAVVRSVGGRTHPVEDDTLDRLTPPIAGAELDAERHTDVTLLRTALSDLADDDRQLLLERHVHDRTVTHIATDLGVRPHAVTMRLRRAEERLAGAFAAAHAHHVNEPECRTTRAAMHDYLKDRLLPRRRSRLEAHMDGCAECTRAFVDVREVSWMLRDLGQHVVAGAMATGALGAAVGAAGGTAEGAAAPRSFGKKETAVAAGVLAAIAIAGGAAAYIGNRPDPSAAQAIVDLGIGDGDGGGGAGGGSASDGGDSGPSSTEQKPSAEKPPSIPPTNPQPRPETTPKEGATAAGSGTAPQEDVANPAPEPGPAAPDAPDPGSGSDPGPDPDTNEPEPEEPPTGPAPEEPGEPEEPTEPPVDPPDVPEEPANGIGSVLDDLLASLELLDLPGIDLETAALDEIRALLLGTSEQAADDAESAA